PARMSEPTSTTPDSTTPDSTTPDATAPGPTTPGLAGPVTSVVPVDLRDYVDFSTEKARRIRVLATDHLAVDLWCLEPGQRSPVLRLPEQDVAYTVLGGRSWFVTDEGEVGLDPLGSILVPADVVHGVHNRGSDPLIVVAAITPPGAERPAKPVADDALAVRHDDRRPNALARAWHTLMGAGGDRTG
ncbi:MAG: hypothetical protein WEB03_02330, partial [Nitriliruptor sp.]|uniref:hypothetical protein n=1 Tax=Nitriliruptor sp. TaxID=2448056 RepID=UPI0034A0972A